MSTQRFTLTLGLVASLSSSLFSCATKKYVAGQVTPVTQRVQKTETRNTEQDQQLDVLERDSSRTRENLVDLKGNVEKLDTQLKSTSETAQGAASAASLAQQQAADARLYATNRSDTIEKTIEGIDQLKLTKTTNVLFNTGRSELTADAKAALDELAKQAAQLKRFAVEVQGFTDSTGSTALNLQLSQRRAENVARYFTVQHQLPLRNIHMIGVGTAAPIADNTTRAGRKQNRRVEIRLFVREDPATVTSAAAQVR
ncbi:MAG: OmpA family protein [Acidobacteria bacterium]|nr:OmpA family protein [Acidobacteriota bacterium]